MDDVRSDDDFYSYLAEQVRVRLSAERFGHAESVASTAQNIARAYGVDEQKARLAGILHDWDKDFKDTEILQRAKELNILAEGDTLESMPRLLHGPTAACSLKEHYPHIPSDVLQAVARHTSGALDMTPLDMVVYIADVIEPLRQHGNADKISGLIGKVNLEMLYLITFKQVFQNLIDRNKRIHPETVNIWNHYISQTREKPGRKGYL